MLVTLLFACKTPEKFDYSLCRTYKVTDPKQISWSENNLKSIDKTLTELRFCTHHPSILSEIIYEEYGKWGNMVKQPKNRMGVLLFWNDILIKGIDQPVNIVTTSYRDAQSTIMIFDKQKNDLLSNTSEYRTYLIDLWTNEINAYDVPNSSSNFSKAYWKERDPKFYKQRFPNLN